MPGPRPAQEAAGDIDDLGTAALAEFLAPSIIISADSVLTRLGWADTLADTWLPTAYKWLRAAGFETTMAETAVLLEMGVRLVFGVGAVAADVVSRHPMPVLFGVAAIAFAAWRRGYLRRDRWREGTQWLKGIAGPWLDRAFDAMAGYADARQALKVIEPYGAPTVEQLAARHLARVRQRLTPAALDEVLALKGYDLVPGELEEALHHHVAFRTRSDGTFGVGRQARSDTATYRNRPRRPT